jgi:DNA-binding IclR family transcriptional regulator
MLRLIRKRAPDLARRNSDSPAAGAQAIRRAVKILKLVARHGRAGLRLTDITKMADLSRPTSHRILKCLIEEGLVGRYPVNNRYNLGLLNYELGLATHYRPDFQERLRPRLAGVANLTGDAVYLIGRSGDDSICYDRVPGRYTKRVTTDVGSRRPLCFGAGGLVILSTLDENTINQILKANSTDLNLHPRLTESKIREAIARTRARGYALIRDTSEVGLSAVAITLRATVNRPMLAVSIGATNERLSPSRARQLCELLRREFLEEI